MSNDGCEPISVPSNYEKCGGKKLSFTEKLKNMRPQTSIAKNGYKSGLCQRHQSYDLYEFYDCSGVEKAEYSKPAKEKEEIGTKAKKSLTEKLKNLKPQTGIENSDCKSDACERNPWHSEMDKGVKKSFDKKSENLRPQTSTYKNDCESNVCERDPSYDLFEVNDCSDEETDQYPEEPGEEKEEIETEALRVNEEPLREEFSFYEPSVPFLPDIDSLLERKCLTILDSQRHIEPITDSIDKTHLFSREVKSRLKNVGFTTASPIQAHLWPNIAKGRSICCISSPRSGKTTAYLISILQLLSNLANDSPKLATGPDYIIVCSCYKVVQNVFDEAMKFRGNEQLPRFIALDSFNEEQQALRILNGCEVMISTPSPLLRLMNTRIDYFKNSTTLIFDDCDKALELHFSTAREIFAKFLVQSKKRLRADENLNRALFVQTIIFGEKLTDKVESFYGTQSRSILLFGNYFEAAVYKKLPNKVTVIENNEKMRSAALIKVLTEAVKSIKFGEYYSIAIVCRDSIESDSVLETVKKLKIDSKNVVPVVINENTPHFEYQRLVARWETGKEILIITDEVLPFLPQVDKVRCLIHFSLPSFSKGAFGARFQLMYKWFRRDDPNNKLVSHIICSCENEQLVLQLYKYLKRCGSSIPPLLASKKKSISRELCPSFLSLGFCPFKKYFCNSRHSFKDEKAITGLPIDGQIKGKITFIKSPNDFYFVIEEYRNKSSHKWQKFERQMPLKSMNEKLQNLRDSDVLEFVMEVKVGDLYAIVVRDTVHRVKVVKDLGQQPLKGYQITKKEKNSTLVVLFHVDFGYYTRAQSYDLIPLPAALKRIPPFANKMYLFGIKPPDNEIEWNAKSTQAFCEKGMGKSATYFTAWVRLQLNGDFWVDTLTMCTKLAQLGVEVVSSKPMNFLIDQKLAERNTRKLSNFNTNRSEILSKWMCERQKVVVQYAFVDDPLSQVYLCHFISFNHFYIRIQKFDDLLVNLEEEIMAELKRRPVPFFVVGLICVTQHESGVLNRVRIEEIYADSVKVFFLDHGETSVVPKRSCFHVDEKFLNRLPFQAIKCKLYGVVGDINKNVIYDYTRYEDEQFKLLLLEKIAVDGDTNVVRLYLKRDQKTPVIYDRVSKWLVDNKYAKYSNLNEMKSDKTKEFVIPEDDVSDDYDSDGSLDPEDPEIRFWNKCLGLDQFKKAIEKNGLVMNKEKIIKKESRAQKVKRSLQKIKSKESDEKENEVQKPNTIPSEFDYEIDRNAQPLPYDPEDDFENLDNNDDDGEILLEICIF